MQGIIAAALTAITQGLMLVNTITSRKYIDEIQSIKIQILDQESKRFESDDALIEYLYQKLKICVDASAEEIKLANSKKTA